MFQLYLMGGIYILLGFAHFTHTEFYRPLMPQFLPAHALLIYLSGFAEILLGLGVFFSLTRNYALWGHYAYAHSIFNNSCQHAFSRESSRGFTGVTVVANTTSISINLLGLYQSLRIF